MQAVILAGGLGTRLRPITEHTPKPMVEVGGRPFLEYIVKHLEREGLQDVLLLTGYLGEHIEDYFGDGRRFNVNIRYSREPRQLGTGGSVRYALSILEPSFLLIYGDSFLPIDYHEVIADFLSSDKRALAVVYDNSLSNTGVKNNMTLDAAGLVTNYDKTGQSEGLRYVEAGVLCLDREVVAALPAGEPISLEHAVFPNLIAARELQSFITTQRFFDIGTPRRLEEFLQLFASTNVPAL